MLPTNFSELILWIEQNNLLSPFTNDPEENHLNWNHHWSGTQGFNINNGIVVVFGF